MIEMTLENVAKSVGGTLNKAAKELAESTINGVSIDTRSIQKGNLFIPFLGENVDGHKFINMAFDKNASASLSEHQEDLNRDVPIIHVENGLAALQHLAATYLNEVDPKVIAITGSNGKTTTKDMIECVLTPYFKVQKTLGNFNNEIGLPLTILQLKKDTEISILEMGMDQTGDIDFLSKLTHPDIAVITNVGESHIEKLGSREAIACGKFEIVNGLNSDGIFIYNGDYPRLNELIDHSAPYKQMSAGTTDLNDFVVSNVKQTSQGTSFTMTGIDGEIQIPQLGAHNAQNAALALLVAHSLGIALDDAHGHFANLKVTDMRMQQMTLQSGTLLINDSYNASVSSMNSALDSIAKIDGDKRIVILADILELGRYTEELHKQVGAHINALGDAITEVITYGDRAKYIHDEVKNMNKQHMSSIEEIVSHLQGKLDDRTIILFKGSRGMQLERIIETLE